jgi:PAS domain S-box-containing protein
LNPSSRFVSGGNSGLQVLWEDGERVFCRGDSRGNGTTSVLAVLPAAEHPASAVLDRLAHEYELRDELDAEWAAKPLEFVREQRQAILLLQDPGGEPLDHLIGRPMGLDVFLRLAVALSVALGRLHARGLVHKDIKPTNVLVGAAADQVWLTGFGIASRLPRERQSPAPPELIEGTLAYMAPEQTGRMNSSIDSRSDLYSLGVTLYQMLTGSLPFTASDPMEWVHCHIAKTPIPPSERLNNIPAPVSAIVMKLLAKAAEDRYQTAGGLGHDLLRCVGEMPGLSDAFPLGERDVPDRLLIPEKLYGREPEVSTLLASFDRSINGGALELVLVSGYSGIGKSSIVNELHKLLVPARGLFASGKFDQYKRDIPYATLVQAFQSLVRSLLGKSETELSPLRRDILGALGPNGRLMIDLVPELGLIIGDQPALPDLPPQETRQRFELVFRRFIGVFAQPEHPLVLFLDDLQWLDVATLDLLEALLTRSSLQHLMLIGAYRDNEVDAAHPLSCKLDAIRLAGGRIAEIKLMPLAREHLGRLIADALHCEPGLAAPLAELVYDKTGGSPFFAVQFLSALADEGLLSFDRGNARWSWSLSSIHAKGYTDNVADLMVQKLKRLPIEARKVLQQLACLGSGANFALLERVFKDEKDQVHGQLWKAVQAGLIFRSERSYRFLHDRIHEAAYCLIPKGSRAELHLRIGRLLAAHTPPEEQEDAIFHIVDQLNRASHLVTSKDEKRHIAGLNLVAGRRARASTAYISALKYLKAGRALLTEECWNESYELIFSIEYLTAECELLAADMPNAENRLSMLATRARSGHDTAIVIRLRLMLYGTLGRNDLGVDVCLQYLRRLGTEWSSHPTEQAVQEEYDRIWRQLGSREIEELLHLPLLTDQDALDTLEVMAEVATAAVLTNNNLGSLFVCRMVNLSLQYGNSDASCFAYVWLAMISIQRFGNYQTGYRFGQLAYDLVEKRHLTRYKARTYMSFGHMVIPWTKNIRTGREPIRLAFENAKQSGDLTFAGYSWLALVQNLLSTGDPLADVQREIEAGLAFARNGKFDLIASILTTFFQLVRSLRGLTPEFGSFDDTEFDELRHERHFSNTPVLWMSEFLYWARKLQARFLAGDCISAVEAAVKAEALLSGERRSHFTTAELHFYGALSHAASWEDAAPERKQWHVSALTNHHRKLEEWAAHCPENFENRAALAGAEIARIEGRMLEAEQLYEQAIRSARQNGFIQNEAIAYELAAGFYAARGFEQFADLYRRNARYGYLRWGAVGKVRQLDERYPDLKQQDPPGAPTSTIGAPVEQLDLATVIKVSQAVSSEIVLESLVDTLMRTAMAQAGAERALLILLRGQELRIEAEATTGGDTVAVRLLDEAVTERALPESVLHYVVRTREIATLDDAAAQSPYGMDSYIRGRHARSILCLPLLNRAKLIGVLYLENNLTPRVFAPARILVLKLLTSQAAIALENAGLYRDVAEREKRQIATSEMLRIIANSPIQSVLDAVAENAARLSDANNAEIFRLDDNLLRLAASYGEIPIVIHAYEGVAVSRDTVTGRAACDRRTIHVHDLAAEQDEYPTGSSNAKREGHRTTLATPLLREGVTIGVILVRRTQLRPFSDEQIALIETFADQAVIAIENARLFEAEKQRSLALARANRDLAEREAKIRRMVEAGIIGIYIWDFEGRVIDANDEFLRMVNYDREDLVAGRIRWTDLTPPDWRDRTNAKMERQRSSGRFEPFEKEYTRKDGSRFHLLVGGATFEQGGDQGIAFVVDLTDQKRAEEKSRESELKLRKIIETVPGLIWSNGPDGDPTHVNQRMLDYSGVRFEEFKHRGWEAFVHPDDFRETADAFYRAIRTGATYEGIMRLRRADGEFRWHHARCEPLRDRRGRIIQWYGLSVDIDERKKAGDQLRRSEAYLVEAERLSHSGSAAYNETEILYFSEEARRMFGFDPRHGIPSREAVWQRIHPDDRDRINEAIERAVRAKKSFGNAFRIVLPDGTIRHQEAINHPVFSAGGKLKEIVVTGIDVTERKRAEDALRESEAKFRDYAETASDWFWEIGPDYKFTLLTENAFGSDPTQRIGTTCWDYALDLETEPEKWRVVRATLDARESFRDFIYCTVDGRGAPMYVKASGKPVFDNGGDFCGYRGTGTDVTAIVRGQRAEASLQTVQAELAHVGRVMTLGQLTASIAHEVNQPIGSARNNARAALNFLDRNPPDLGEVREALGCIVADADRAGGIIDRIRDQIRKVPPRSDRFDLNRAIEEVIGLAQSMIAEHGISMQSRLAGGMAPVRGDRIQLQQVILNLILNAIEAMSSVEAGERKLVIGTEQNEENGTLVTVRDSGSGIDPKHLERVFDAFYSTKSGMGMGLSICRSIVAAHGGRLWTVPNEPRGAVFQFTLPNEAKSSIVSLERRKKTSL